MGLTHYAVPNRHRERDAIFDAHAIDTQSFQSWSHPKSSL